MYHLPRCASVLSDEIDAETFFKELSNIDVKKDETLSSFLGSFRGTRFRVAGISESILITGGDASALADFEQFSLDLWKQYYIQEDVYQLGILEDKSPLEVAYGLLFITTENDQLYQGCF